MTATLTPTELFDQMVNDPRWGGYGYLGEREYMSEDLRKESDEFVYEFITELYTNPDALFQFANSRPGRHYADSVISTESPLRSVGCLEWFAEVFDNERGFEN